MKLIVGHSQKIPQAEDYSSSGFSCTLEVEVPEDQAQDASSVQSWLQELYTQAKQAVEEQIRSVPRRNGNQPAPTNGIFGRPNDSPNPAGNGGGTASPKQVSYIISLGARSKLSYADLVRIAQERFKVEDLYQLPKQAASQLIDEMKPDGSRQS